MMVRNMEGVIQIPKMHAICSGTLLTTKNKSKLSSNVGIKGRI
jgi:hypothetical protein